VEAARENEEAWGKEREEEGEARHLAEKSAREVRSRERDRRTTLSSESGTYKTVIPIHS